jgi:hypothetical protein
MPLLILSVGWSHFAPPPRPLSEPMFPDPCRSFGHVALHGIRTLLRDRPEHSHE